MRRLTTAAAAMAAFSALFATPALADVTGGTTINRVNPSAAGDQSSGGAGMASDGHYWVSYNEQIHTANDPNDVEHPNVFVRRVTAAGDPTGNAIPVNASTASRDFPDVAVAPDGKFVVVYRFGGTNNPDVKAQRFDANGAPVGSEFTVNVTTTGYQAEHQVTMAPNGKFVVVWHDASTSTPKIFARLFNADGSPATGEVEVANGDAGGGNTRSLKFPDVDMDSTGKFVVTWERSTRVGEQGLIVYRRFNANGTAAAGQKTAFTGETNFNYFVPIVALRDNGELVIVFQGAGTLPGTRIQRVNASDVPQGTPTSSSSVSGVGTQIAMDPVDGEFVLAWHVSTNANSQVYVRDYAANATPQGLDVPVSQGAAPALATDGAGRMGLAWSGNDGFDSNTDLNGGGVFTRRFNYGAVSPPPPPPECSDDADNDGDGKIDFPADPGCTAAADTSESPDPAAVGGTGGSTATAPGTAAAAPQCADRKDNDSDGAVDAQDPGCKTAADTNEADESVRDLVLCGRRDVSLVRADVKGRQVELRGLVSSRFAGGPVKILANYRTGAASSRFTVAKTVKSAANGEFTARVKGPPRRLFIKARYRAQVGSARSVALKLPQSLASSSVRKQGEEIVLKGKVTRALLGRKPQAVVVKRLVCGRYQTVGSAKPRKSGAYTVRFKAPALGTAALYRAESRVLAKPGSRRYVKQFARAIGITLTGQTG